MIKSMRVSVSLPDEDVAFLDRYATRSGSRSAAVHEAVQLLRSAGLEDAYAAAEAEWETSDDARLWDAVSGDGLG